MSTANICILIAIIVYLILVIGIGVVFSKSNKTTDDFYLGGRKLGPFVTAMSAEASDMSSYLLMGLPGLAYTFGLAEVTWTAIGLAIGTYLNWLFVAKRLRRYTEITNSTTLPEFFSKRFHDNRKILSVIAACFIIIFFVPYTASGFSACGKLFASLFGADYVKAMIISAIVITAYTTLGGFLAASTSDFLQSIVMSIALVIVLAFGIVNAGGIGAVADNAKSMIGYLDMTKVYNGAGESLGSFGLIPIVSTLAWGLGYFGMPHILLRFMAIEDEKKLKLSRRIASIWAAVAMAAAILIGIIGNALSKCGVIPVLEDGETILVAIATAISKYGVIAALIAGVILAGILAATMSTADSQLLAASSSVSQNIVKEVFFKNISEKTAMIIARITVVVIAVIAVFIARDANSSVFRIVSFAWAGFGAVFGPIILFSLFWKRTTFQGALAGMVSGGIMVFVWKYLIRPLGGALDIYELLPAFIVGTVFIVIVSLLTSKPDNAIETEFEKAKVYKNI
ncbi:MAG: sodium/proline symporter PutP [Eubacterium sp.]